MKGKFITSEPSVTDRKYLMTVENMTTLQILMRIPHLLQSWWKYCWFMHNKYEMNRIFSCFQLDFQEISRHGSTMVRLQQLNGMKMWIDCALIFYFIHKPMQQIHVSVSILTTFMLRTNPDQVTPKIREEKYGDRNMLELEIQDCWVMRITLHW